MQPFQLNRNPSPTNGPIVHRFSNGLTLIVEQMPVEAVTLDIWIKAGSAVEHDAMSGIAHFLEHMIFKGSKNLHRGEFERRVEERGALINAATSQDYTHYYLTSAPQDFLDLAPLQLDMVLHPTIPPDEFKQERNVILEEIRRAEDSPRHRTYYRTMKVTFDRLPYRRPILGSSTTIETLTPEQMKYFHQYWYQPQNLTLVIVGNLAIEKLINMVSESLPESLLYGPNLDGNLNTELYTSPNDTLSKVLDHAQSNPLELNLNVHETINHSAAKLKPNKPENKPENKPKILRIQNSEIQGSKLKTARLIDQEMQSQKSSLKYRNGERYLTIPINTQNLIPEPPFQTIQRHEYQDHTLQQARLIMVWRVPGITDLEKTYALDVIAAILSHGRTSRLVWQLRELEQLVSSVLATNSLYTIQGVFSIATKLSISNLEKVETKILQNLHQLQTELITEVEVLRIRNQVANRFTFGNERPAERARLYGYYQTLVGALEPAVNYPQRIRSLSVEDVQKAAQCYLLTHAYSAIIIKPGMAESKDEVLSGVPH